MRRNIWSREWRSEWRGCDVIFILFDVYYLLVCYYGSSGVAVRRVLPCNLSDMRSCFPISLIVISGAWTLRLRINVSVIGWRRRRAAVRGGPHKHTPIHASSQGGGAMCCSRRAERQSQMLLMRSTRRSLWPSKTLLRADGPSTASFSLMSIVSVKSNYVVIVAL